MKKDNNFKSYSLCSNLIVLWSNSLLKNYKIYCIMNVLFNINSIKIQIFIKRIETV